MTQQLKDIGFRLIAIREAQDRSAEEIAGMLEMPVSEYLAYEAGERDFSFSFLYNFANRLGVDILDIISGEAPKLSTCCLVRKGGGYDVGRDDAYDYRHLAFTFRDKKAEPFMVTIRAKDNRTIDMHAHEGQEFNYIVEGKMEFIIGDMVYMLNEGDSVYFNSATPHAEKALSEQVRFIAVVIK